MLMAFTEVIPAEIKRYILKHKGLADDLKFYLSPFWDKTLQLTQNSEYNIVKYLKMMIIYNNNLIIIIFFFFLSCITECDYGRYTFCV